MRKLLLGVLFLLIPAISMGMTYCQYKCGADGYELEDGRCSCEGLVIRCNYGYVEICSDNECECVRKATCEENQIYNEADNTCQNGLPELNLKNFTLTRLVAGDNSLIIELTRNSGPYAYTLVLEMSGFPTEVRRYCKGSPFCNVLSRGNKCVTSNWSDWCYNEE